MRKYHCIIVDDDEIDRLAVTVQAKKYPQLEVVGSFRRAAEALPHILSGGIDILFLDIDMPSINGFELRKMAADVPVCVFITAHPEHAFRAFELDTFDFIEKPLKSDRFAATFTRILEYLEMRHKAAVFDATLPQEALYIKDGFGRTRIDLYEVRYLEALKDYTKIALPGESHSVLSHLGQLLDTPDFSAFVRVHRSYAVNRHYVKRIAPNEILLDTGIKIPVGRSYKSILKTDL